MKKNPNKIALLRGAGFGLIVAIAAMSLSCEKSEPVRVKVVLKRYEFSPAVIEIRKGQPVVLELTTADVAHGFKVPELGLNKKVAPGQPATLEFTPRRGGEFQVVCSMMCGPHHEDMHAKIVVR